MKNKTFRKLIAASVIMGILVFNYTTVNAQDHKVFIDAGHGGRDNGSAHNGYIEDSINLQIAQKLKEELKKQGIDVEMSREDDIYLSLAKRTEKSNSSDADIFVSIHQNASLNSNANGAETYYMGDNNKKLATDIQNNIIQYTNFNDRGIRTKNLQVLRDNQKTSVLIECGFISNNKEGYKLSTHSYQEKMAKGIAKGIKTYLEKNESEIIYSNKTNVKSNTLNNAVALNDVNVMSDRGKNFEILGTLEKGTKVEVIDTKFDWHKIKYKDSVGYVSAVYVK